jgi:hypothetical protein
VTTEKQLPLPGTGHYFGRLLFIENEVFGGSRPCTIMEDELDGRRMGADDLESTLEGHGGLTV